MTIFRVNFLAIPIFLFQIIFARSVYADQNKTLYLTLEKSIEICLAENRQLRASYSRIAQADQKLKQSRCDFLPKFSMTYGYKKNRYAQDHRP